MNDTEVEPSETIILRLASSEDYTIGNPSGAAVYITSEGLAPVAENTA